MSKEDRIQCAGRNCLQKNKCLYHSNYLNYSIEDADTYRIGKDCESDKCNCFKLK